MTDYQRIILVHYHEIGLKGHNRASFETRLQKNLEALLAGYPVVTIHRISGRICVFLREGTGWDTAVEASELARGVPGVARVSSGFKCERDLDVMVDAAERAMREAGEFASFKVAARRNHTDFAVGSMDMNRIIGAKLCAAFPEAEVRAERLLRVRAQQARDRRPAGGEFRHGHVPSVLRHRLAGGALAPCAARGRVRGRAFFRAPPDL